MTRSSTKELFTPFKDPEREFRSSRKYFKTLSLDESRSPDFDLFSDQEEYSEEEVAETMAETIEQYMSKTRADYGSGIARPKIKDKDSFELKGQFLKELRDNTFSGSNHEYANEHIKKVLEIVDLFHIPNITIDQEMLRAFPILKEMEAGFLMRNNMSDRDGLASKGVYIEQVNLEDVMCRTVGVVPGVLVWVWVGGGVRSVGWMGDFAGWLVLGGWVERGSGAGGGWYCWWDSVSCVQLLKALKKQQDAFTHLDWKQIGEVQWLSILNLEIILLSILYAACTLNVARVRVYLMLLENLLSAASQETPSDLTTGDCLSPKVKLFLIPFRGRSLKRFFTQAQLNNLGREIKKVNEKVYAAQVGCEQCKGPHYTKDCPLTEEGKTIEEAYYTQFGAPFKGGGYRATALGFYELLIERYKKF
ncbi:hypothetical protein Tco_0307494 [Tanacetum coccineum]